MNKGPIIALMALLTTLLMPSCRGGAGGHASVNDTVAIKTQRLSDTTSFVKSNGERMAIYADATIQYPASGDSLQRLFAQYVLEGGDTLTLADAMRLVVTNSLHQYDFMTVPQTDEGAQDEAETDAEVIYKYNTSTRVTPIYNRNGVVTFVRLDVVKKNDKVTSVTHRYYSFDCTTPGFIDVNNLFRDDALSDLCQLLQQQLLSQNNATGNDDLTDMGYFNVENITVTRNFYFDENGMTWSYLPNELAVEAVGEPTITIPYGELQQFECENSLLSRIN